MLASLKNVVNGDAHRARRTIYRIDPEANFRVKR